MAGGNEVSRSTRTRIIGSYALMSIRALPKQFVVLLYILLIWGVLAHTFLYAKQKGMHQMFYPLGGRAAESISIAMSHFKHDLKGYRGYSRILSTLHQGTASAHIPDPATASREEIAAYAVRMNQVLNRAMTLEKVADLGMHRLFREDKGSVLYYELAFRIFGIRVEGFFYLYFVLFGISLSIFTLTFCNRLDLLNFLLLITCAHFAVVASVSGMGWALETIHNSRFMGVLGIVPMFYMAFLIWGYAKVNYLTIIGMIIQTAILVFVIFIRSSASYQLFFLISLFGLRCLWVWLRNPRFGVYNIRQIRFSPLLIAGAGVLLLVAHLQVTLSYPYTNVMDQHSFWHPLYLGLGAHPDSERKYGITFSDPVAFDRVEQLAPGTLQLTARGDYDKYEAVLKNEYLKIWHHDPQFVIANYFYKIPIFLKNYVSFYGRSLWERPVMWGVVFAGLVRMPLSPVCFSCLGFLLLALAWSCVPFFVAMPEGYLIADSALLSTVAIYVVLTGCVCLFLRKTLITGGGHDVVFSTKS